MVRVVLTYGPTSPRLRADLSSLTCLGPSCPRAELSGTPSNRISFSDALWKSIDRIILSFRKPFLSFYIYLLLI
jgi:hypothetical protein